jgi:hypothetical protein
MKKSWQSWQSCQVLAKRPPQKRDKTAKTFHPRLTTVVDSPEVQ